MIVQEIFELEPMLNHYELLTEVYPDLTREAYETELRFMLTRGYSQAVIYEDGTPVALTGLWLGSKLWCGKYLELDNVVVASSKRSSGYGKLLFDYAEKKAEKEGCTMLALDSYTHNFKAHKFFYNQGYSPKGFHFIKILKKENVR